MCMLSTGNTLQVTRGGVSYKETLQLLHWVVLSSRVVVLRKIVIPIPLIFNHSNAVRIEFYQNKQLTHQDYYLVNESV